MCGIAGILHFDIIRPVEENTLLMMRDAMAHRGPDGSGNFLETSVGLAHRRLSILDLSENGKQPFSTPDGRYHITYNGEIFNFRELRKNLENLGYGFRSNTDTEVLLYMYQQYGGDALPQLNGMFAFAIWDSHAKEVFIARDRVGIKPLYYAIYNGTFYFASEPKALFAAGVPAILNEEAFAELLLFRYIAGEQTTFKYVKRLLPGHAMLIKGERIQISRWWDLPKIIESNRENLPQDSFKWFEETFYSSVAYRTISDVPVGVMISGGLDSNSVAAALHHEGFKNLASFTVTFDEKAYNEGPLAKLAAKKFGLRYYDIEVKGEELYDLLVEASWYHDEPLVHQNDAQMLALAKYAKKYVTVLLSGEGADELMGGYYRYKPLEHHKILQRLHVVSNMIRLLPGKDIVNRFDKLGRYVADSRLNSLILLNVANIYPQDLAEFGISIDPEQFEYRHRILQEARSIYPAEPARQAMYLDLFTHMSSVLDRNDRMTMGASIECRMPFLDYRFLEMIPALPSDLLLKGKKGKWLMFNSIGKHLPEEVRKFRKLGFSVPWEEYMRENKIFKEFINQIESEEVFHLPIFEKLSSKKIKSLFQQQNPVSQAIVRQLFMLSIWHKTYFSVFKGSKVSV